MSPELEQFNPPIGKLERLEDGIARIVAPNPSPMTYRGTNTYIIGHRSLAVIDPGPDNDEHLNAILGAIENGQQIRHILVTHSHIDHSPLAKKLSAETGAPIYAFGPSESGRSQAMLELIAQGYYGGGEGIDLSFQPDHLLKDGQCISLDDWDISVIHTPGHMGNHICFQIQDILFSGDHVMGWASSMVSPPDGDLTDFMASCRKLITTQWRVFYPGHGDSVTSPNERVEWLIRHRESREAEICHTLKTGAMKPASIAEVIYTDTPKSLLGAATRNVFAHLIDLTSRELVKPIGRPHPDAEFTLNNKG